MEAVTRRGLMVKEGAQVPEELREAWAAKQHVIVSHDGARIDFHGGGNALLRPRYLTEDELAKVTDAFVVSLAHPKVTSINVTICKSLTDESIKAIAKGCPELKKLNVSVCKSLTDESIKAIAKGCPKLKELNVSDGDNLTNKSIKAIVKGCPELKELNVGSTKNLTVEWIKAIAKGCPKLKECKSLTGESIKAIANGCPELKELNVSEGENLTNESIEAIVTGCPELKELNVGSIENLTDESITAIAEGCPKLKELNVSECKSLTDESIKAIANGCPELKELNVSGGENLTDESIKAIAKGCPELTELNVWGIESLTDESIKAIAKGCPELTGLNVCCCNRISDSSIKAIAMGCPKLKELNVSCCNRISDSPITVIADACPELKELNVSYCNRISDTSIRAIANGCPELQQLNVAGIGSLTDESIKVIAMGCPELKVLNLSYCDRISDSSIKAITKGCPELKELNLSYCNRITDSSMKTIATGCPELCELNLSFCNRINDSSINAIAKGCPELMKLNVSWIENLTDQSMKAIAKGCPELMELSVNKCNNLTDESMKAIAKGCPELKELNVEGVENLTDDSMKAIARGCPELKALGITWCRRLSDSCIKAIAEGCPKLKKLNVSECRTNDSWMKAISEGLPGLEELNANLCYVESLPADFFDRLSRLILIDLRNNKLTSLPPSIVKHEHLQQLHVSGNPLESPPHEIATQGLDAIKRYLEELERGSSVSKLLKVVLVGDGEAGKTSLRNALAGRPNPRHEDRTVHIDIEKITLTNDLDINVYDCGGQEEYITTQLPYLTGLALYMVVVEAQYATEDYAHVVEDKLHRFLVVLQNRVPGAVVLPIVTKVDTVEDPETRCHWLESAIEKWMQRTRETVSRGLPEASVDHQKPLSRRPAVADADDMRNSGNCNKRNFIPLRVQAPALPVSVADAEDVQAVSSSVRAVRDSIITLTKHDPPLLRGVGQKVPTTYLAVLKLFGAIAEYGDNGGALEALREDTAHALGDTLRLSPAGIYRPKNMLRRIWNVYRDERYVNSKGNVFDDATQLWEAQGLIFVDAGLVFLQPEVITAIVKPLVDHRYNDEEGFKLIKADVRQFLESTLSRDNDKFTQLIDALDIFRASGEFDCSDDSVFLSFLWRHTGLNKSHYGQVLQMLVRSHVILKVERDSGEKGTIAVVHSRLPKNPNPTRFEALWPKFLPSKERELNLRFEALSAFPTGFAERFLTDVHGLGTSVYSWRNGVFVWCRAGITAVAERRENVLCFTVRFPSISTDAAWKALYDAQRVLAAQRESYFPWLFYTVCFLCEACCRTRRRLVSIVMFDASRRKIMFAPCGHRFDVDSTGECNESAVI